MTVRRVSPKFLNQILAGRIKEKPSLVVIKFYRNNCHYCHGLHSDYAQIAEDDSDEEAHYFAFNIDDQPSIQRTLRFEGVPTICTILVSETRPRVKLMPDPKDPHRDKWYYSNDIKKFIAKEKKSL